MSLRRLVVFIREEDDKPDKPFLTCLKCFYYWQPLYRRRRLPKFCPRCRREKWWLPKTYGLRCSCGHVRTQHRHLDARWEKMANCRFCNCARWDPQEGSAPGLPPW